MEKVRYCCVLLFASEIEVVDMEQKQEGNKIQIRDITIYNLVNK